MKIAECYLLGEIVKSHGLNGELVIFLDVDDPADYHDLKSIYIERDHQLVPFFVESLLLRGNKAITALEDIEDVKQAEQFIRQKVYLPLTDLPKLSEGQYYFHELLKCEVVEGKNSLGTVAQVLDVGSNQLIAVVNETGRELLIPLHDDIVKHLDRTNKEITVELPDGLLDLYS